MADYLISELAKLDLKRIYKYGFERYGEIQADRYFSELFEYFERIASQPLLFPTVDHIRVGYRICVCGSDSIYYRIMSGKVEIISIIGSQDTDEWIG